MRKKLKVLLCGGICISMLLSGCASQEKKSKEPQYADEKFITDMGKGLEARWGLNAKDEKKEGYKDILTDSTEYKTMMLSYIDAELNSIGKYTDEKFENSKLQETALKYINLLKEHKKICDYVTVDYNKYAEEFNPIYNERSKIILELSESNGLKVSEKYAENLKEFSTNAQLVTEQETKREAISSMLEGVQFQSSTDDGSGYKTYQAIVENVIDIDFKTLQISINLLDANGVIVETTYDSISNFTKGAKAQFEFMTDKEFATTQVMADYWE